MKIDHNCFDLTDPFVIQWKLDREIDKCNSSVIFQLYPFDFKRGDPPPAINGCYILLKEYQETHSFKVMYIGSTQNIKIRMLQHAINPTSKSMGPGNWPTHVLCVTDHLRNLSIYAEDDDLRKSEQVLKYHFPPEDDEEHTQASGGGRKQGHSNILVLNPRNGRIQRPDKGE